MTTKLPLYAKIALVLLAAVLFFYILSVGKDVLVPLAFGLLFALLLDPLHQKLTKRFKFPVVLSIFICILCITIIMLGILFFITWQITVFASDFSSMQQKFVQIWDKLQQYVEHTFHVEPQKQIDYLKKSTGNMTSVAGNFLGLTLAFTTGALGFIAIIPVILFLFLYYRELLKNFLLELVDASYRPTLNRMLRNIRSVVQNYMIGLMTVISIVAILNSTGLMILGIDHAIFFGTLAALLLVIPYIGIIIGSLLPVIIALITKDSAWYAVGVIGVFWLVQILEANLITPLIVGDKVKLNSMAIIVALLIGGQLWGPPGMILAIPFTAILKVVFDSVEFFEPLGKLMGTSQQENQESIKLKRKSERLLNILGQGKK